MTDDFSRQARGDRGAPDDGNRLIAWPVTYRMTGVKTFILGMDGKVLEADLGINQHNQGAHALWH